MTALIGIRQIHHAISGRASACCLLLLVLVATQTFIFAQHISTAAHKQQAAKLSPNLQEAEDLVRQGNFEQAKVKIQTEIQGNPSSVEAYDMLGFVSTQQGDYASAQEALTKALRIAPNSTKTHSLLGNLYVAEGKIDLAEKEFRSALRINPADREANYNLGLLLISTKQPAEAIRYLERVRPANVPTQVNLVRAYLEDKRPQDALRIATEVSEHHKDDVQLHFTLGVLLASEQQYKPAELELEEADALQPGTFEILHNLGQAYLRDRNNAKAEIALNRALKFKPDSPETLSLLAQVYASESRPMDALDLLTRAHKIAPGNPDIIFQMAQVSISQHYFEDAIPLLESGLKIAPQRVGLTAALGESYFMSGKVDKAIDVFKKLLQMDPSSRSYLYLGISYENLGRFDEASHYFQEGLKLNPNDSACLFHLGYIAERQGDDQDAEAKFQAVLRLNPDFADALLELANLRMAKKRYTEAADLLRRYVKVSRNPATGYYKLAMVERSLHETAAADRDLGVFQTLSKNASTGAYPYEHLFDYVDSRSKLAPQAREQMDIAELKDEIKKHPDQPEDLYMLAEAYLKVGKPDDARQTIAELDRLSSADYRTEAGAGVLLARYHLYDEAIQHFQLAMAANPSSDEVKFDIADAYFRKGRYSEALDAAEQVSPDGRKEDTYLALLGDIYAHLAETVKAQDIFRDAINRNPDNDQGYLSLALLQIRSNDLSGAKATLLKGQARVPGSGKILWGLGLVSVLEGNTKEAEDQLARAVDLLPEWPGSYSTLGVFYFQTGQIEKAKEVLSRFKNSNAGGLDVNRIEQVLAQASPAAVANDAPMSMANRQQLLQLALSLADRTL
ncbi:MAG TPA: tetratricopeptide repeat protein [Silvibacterium sp.]|nr:tetratricopeptide repeat protein [Silvibacterium sp.]